MDDVFLRAKEIFLRIREEPEDCWAALLQAECDDSPTLRSTVEELLKNDRAPTIPELDTGTTEPPPASDDPLVGVRVGNYTIQAWLGGGGMGSVYLAERDDPAQDVALKLVRLERHSGQRGERLKELFTRETQALAVLNHPTIPNMFEAGECEVNGHPYLYFVMQVIPGAVPITEFVTAHGLQVPEVLDLIAKIADGVHHAHQSGTIHRDIKPSNLLISQNGDPFVIDFGIAKLLENPDYTEFVPRTQQYASPEQLLNRTNAIRSTSDIWSLGVVLYELLTGDRPYEDAREGEQRVITPPSKTVPRIRRDLDDILQKALMYRPEDRYQGANEFAEDLRRFQRSDPVLARPLTVSYFVTSFARRHKAAFAAMVSVLIALVVATGISVDQRIKAEAAARDKERAAKDTYLALTQRIQSALAANDVAAAEALIERRPPDIREREGWELDHLKSRLSQALSGQGDTDPRTAIPVFLDDETLVSAHKGTGISRWSLESDQLIWEWTASGDTAYHGLAACRLADPSQRLIVGITTPQKDHTGIHLLGDDGKVLDTEQFHGAAMSLALSPNGELLAVDSWRRDTNGTEHARLLLYNIVGTTPAHAKLKYGTLISDNALQSGSRIAFSPKSNWLVVADYDNSRLISVYRVGEWAQPIARIHDPHEYHISAVTFDDDERFLVSASVNGTVMVWDLAAIDALAKREGPLGTIAPDDWDGILANRFRTASGVHTIDVRNGSSPDSLAIVLGGTDLTLSHWQVGTDPMTPRWYRRTGSSGSGHTGQYVYSAVFSPDGSRIVSTDDNGTILVWPSDPSPPVTLLSNESMQFGHGTSVEFAEFTQDATHLVSCDADGGVAVWDVELAEGVGSFWGFNRLEAYKWQGHCAGAQLLGAASGGLLLAMGRHWRDSEDRSAPMVVLWNLGFGPRADSRFDAMDPTLLGEYPIAARKNAEVHGMATSPDGNQLAAAATDGSVTVWDVVRDSHTTTLNNPRPYQVCEQANDVVFVDSNRILVAAGRAQLSGRARPPDQTPLSAFSGVIVVDLKTGGLIKEQLDVPVRAIATQASERGDTVLACAREDGHIDLFRVDAESTCSPLGRLSGHTKPASALAFLGEDRLVSGGDDRTLHVWNWRDTSLLAVLRDQRGQVMSLAVSQDERIASASAGWRGSENGILIWERATTTKSRSQRSDALAMRRLLRPRIWAQRKDSAGGPLLGRLDSLIPAGDQHRFSQTDMESCAARLIRMMRQYRTDEIDASLLQEVP